MEFDLLHELEEIYDALGSIEEEHVTVIEKNAELELGAKAMEIALKLQSRGIITVDELLEKKAELVEKAKEDDTYLDVSERALYYNANPLEDPSDVGELIETGKTSETRFAEYLLS